MATSSTIKIFAVMTTRNVWTTTYRGSMPPLALSSLSKVSFHNLLSLQALKYHPQGQENPIRAHHQNSAFVKALRIDSGIKLALLASRTTAHLLSFGTSDHGHVRRYPNRIPSG